MRNCKEIFILLFFLSALPNCSGHLRLKSNPPEAKVELVQPNSPTNIDLGQTPLQLSNSDLTDKQSSGPYIIRISKEGFTEKEIIFSNVSGLQIDLNFELKPEAVSSQTNLMIEQLFEAQALAQKGELDGCLKILNQLQKDFPHVSAVYEMRAQLYMLKADFNSAINDLVKVVSITPENKSAKLMLETARSRVGGNRQ